MLKKNIFPVLIALICSHLAAAAIPTVEGLFRNPNNQDVASNSVISKMLFTKLGNSDRRVVEQEIYLKLIFTQNDDATDMAQFDYSSGKMDDSVLLGSKLLQKFQKSILSDKNAERGIFYAVLSMLHLNSSRSISYALKKINRDFPMNEALMNEDQIRLYARQKKYFSNVKKGQISPQASSPFRPSSDEERLKVNEILNADMYRKTEYVSLVKENEKFYWKVKMDKIEALFTNEEHRIEKLVVETNGGTIEFNFNDYVLFDGVHELPKNIFIKDGLQNRYGIRILALAHATTLDKKTQDFFKGVTDPQNHKGAEASRLSILY